MKIELTPDQKPFVRQAIESGRLQREEDAVQEAVALWEERERGRAEFLATLDEARASLATAAGRPVTQQSMRELATEVKESGRARLIAELARTPQMLNSRYDDLKSGRVQPIDGEEAFARLREKTEIQRNRPA